MFRTLLLILSLFLGLATPALAAKDTFRVSFNELPPWKVLDENGNPDGVDVAFLQSVAQRMSLALEFVPFPFKRGLKMIELGEVDLMVGVLRRSEREAYAHFITPPYRTETSKAFYVLKGNEATISEYEDLRSLAIGTQLGGKYFPRFDQDTDVDKHAVKHTLLNIKMLLAGHIDGFITTETSGDYRIAKLGYSDRIGKAQYVYREGQAVHMILSKRSRFADRLSEFNQTMQALLEQGEYQRIKAKFLAMEPVAVGKKE